MQQFYISQGLSERVPTLLTTAHATSDETMYWYCHNVSTMQGEFVIVMEDQTHYCVLIRNTEPKHLDKLPTFFKHRLLREVLTLTEANEKLSKRIEVSILDFCKTSQFTVGLDYGISGELYDVACKLQAIMNNLDLNVDIDAIERIATDNINQTPYIDENGSNQVPFDQFREFWLNKLGITLAPSSRFSN